MFSFCISWDKTDWMRIGAFSMDSSEAILTERLSFPARIPKEDETQTLLKSTGCCVLKNVKTGIWIAGSTNLPNSLLLCEASNLHAYFGYFNPF